MGPSGLARRYLQAQWRRAVRLHEDHARGAGRRSSQRRNRSAAAVEFPGATAHRGCSVTSLHPADPRQNCCKVLQQILQSLLQTMFSSAPEKRLVSITNQMWPGRRLQCKRAFRLFINRLNQAVYGNAVRRYNKRLRVLPVLERGEVRSRALRPCERGNSGRWHIHCAIDHHQAKWLWPVDRKE